MFKAFFEDLSSTFKRAVRRVARSQELVLLLLLAGVAFAAST
jgi:hypothetical protein